jgi:hypothetical protein
MKNKSFVEEMLEDAKNIIDKEKDQIISLLLTNKWEKMEEALDEEYDNTISYVHDNAFFSIDITDKEIVLVGGMGDFAHLERNVYSLIGYCHYYSLFLFHI